MRKWKQEENASSSQRNEEKENMQKKLKSRVNTGNAIEAL